MPPPRMRRMPKRRGKKSLLLLLLLLLLPLLWKPANGSLGYDTAFFSGHQAAKEEGVYTLLARSIIDLARRRELKNRPSFLELGCGHGFLISALQHELRADDPPSRHNVLCLEGSATAKVFWPKDSVGTYFQVDLNRLMQSSLSHQKHRVPATDVVITLEVAEHLLHPRAFVDLILTHAPDVVVFGAATPGQGGHIHINEKPLSFWVNLFEAKGYFLLAEETARMRLSLVQSNSFDRAPWYFKNLLLFSSRKEEVGPQLRPKMSLMPYGCATVSSVDDCDPALAKRDFFEWETLLARARMKAAELKCREHGGCPDLEYPHQFKLIKLLRIKLDLGLRRYILRMKTTPLLFSTGDGLLNSIREMIFSRNDIIIKNEEETFILVSERTEPIYNDARLLSLMAFGRDRTELRGTLKLLFVSSAAKSEK
jgi:hypothetical protein